MVAIANPRSLPAFAPAPSTPRTAPVDADRRSPAVAPTGHRLGLEALAWLAVAVAVLAAFAFLATQPATAPAPDTTTYLVEPGETWWSIASSRVPVGETDDYVRALIATNGGAEVPGPVIQLPPQ